MTSLQVFAFVTIMPVVFMGIYINNKDRDKEPYGLRKKLFIYGVLSIIPILILEILLGIFLDLDDNTNYLRLFINIFVSVGLIEEGAKWVIVNKAMFYDKEFNHPYDAIIYTVFMSLGFAAVENVLYVAGNGLLTGILRGVTAIPVHTCNGIIMGYFIGKSKTYEYQGDINNAKKNMLYSLLIPVITHTTYDFVIGMANDYSLPLLICSVVALVITGVTLVAKVSKINNNFDGTHENESMMYSLNPNSSLFNYALLRVLVLSVVLIIVSGFFLI